jgi:hypothetical protein
MEQSFSDVCITVREHNLLYNLRIFYFSMELSLNQFAFSP